MFYLISIVLPLTTWSGLVQKLFLKNLTSISFVINFVIAYIKVPRPYLWQKYWSFVLLTSISYYLYLQFSHTVTTSAYRWSICIYIKIYIYLNSWIVEILYKVTVGNFDIFVDTKHPINQTGMQGKAVARTNVSEETQKDLVMWRCAEC